MSDTDTHLVPSHCTMQTLLSSQHYSQLTSDALPPAHVEPVWKRVEMKLLEGRALVELVFITNDMIHRQFQTDVRYGVDEATADVQDFNV